MVEGKSLGKHLLGRQQWRWKNNIEIDFKELDGVDEKCMYVFQDYALWPAMI
jgi:ABC-type nitrate/sulfonate/bicarbonate transport system ATPase subunit